MRIPGLGGTTCQDTERIKREVGSWSSSHIPEVADEDEDRKSSALPVPFEIAGRLAQEWKQARNAV